jgi:HK97 family phage portal protein
VSGAITVYVDGMPVTVEDRIYSLDSNGHKIDADAHKTFGMAAGPVQLWRTQRALRTVTGFLARNIAQVALHGFTTDANDDRDRVERSDPLARMLRKPDRTQTAYEFMHTLVIDVCLFDRYCALVVQEQDGAWRLVRVPPDRWKFDRSASGRPKSIKARRENGTEYTISLEQCLWLDGYPSDVDTSPLASLLELLEEERQGSAYRRDLWKRGGRLAGWIQRPADAPDWSPAAKAGFKAGWEKFAAGGDKAGGTPLLEDGMEYHELTGGITPKTAQQIEGRKFSIAEVAAAYYVSPVLVGVLDGANYSNVSAYREILYADTLGTWFQQIEQAYNTRVLPQITNDDETYVEFNVGEKLRMSFEDQARIFQTLGGAPVMTRNEIRKRLNLPPIDGGDELIVPLNVLEGGQASPTDSGTQNEGASE